MIDLNEIGQRISDWWLDRYRPSELTVGEIRELLRLARLGQAEEFRELRAKYTFGRVTRVSLNLGELSDDATDNPSGTATGGVRE